MLLEREQSLYAFSWNAKETNQLKVIKAVLLCGRMEALNASLEKLRREHEKHELWFQQFRQALAGMTAIVARVERALEREMAQREARQSLLERLLEAHERHLEKLNMLTTRHRLIINSL